MRGFYFFLASVFLVVGPASAREAIRVVGSSTVYPFVAAAAEQFGEIGIYKTPIVESTGTGGGMKLFCSGTGIDTPDMVNASRPMTESELATCHKNKVDAIAEFSIGYDGIIIVSQKGTPAVALSKGQLFLALAKLVPDQTGERLITNPYKRWRQIDRNLPNAAIEFYGPPPTSGTRDAFVEMVMQQSCAALPAFVQAYPDEKDRKKHCGLLREDGAYIDSGEDDNIIVQKLENNEKAFGILGYSFYEENSDKVQANTVDGELPSYTSIESGKYTLSRSLFVYVKHIHLNIISGLKEFLLELTSDNALGLDGYMVERGLLPLPEKMRRDTQRQAREL